MIDSKELFEKLNLEYYSYIDEPVLPEKSNVRFIDIIPEVEGLNIANKFLYLHQKRTYDELLKGKNVILKSGTGSGKTEAWIVYAMKHGLKTLVVYPTLALASDQIKRIETYSERLKINSLSIDSLRKAELLQEYKFSKLHEIISNQSIIVTNPAFLMYEIKRITKNLKSILSSFIRQIDFLVFDEIDFYTPRGIALIQGMINILSLICDKKFQIMSLTAMIENPEDLASFFKEVNGRETAIIEGKQFRVENRTYVVLGRNLKKIWERIREEKNNIKNLPKEIEEYLNDYQRFKNNYFKVIEFFRGQEIEIGNIDFDLTNFLRQYVYDDCVTLVFTRGISRAEEIARRIRLELPEDQRNKVATHHHLVSKELRREIEEGARKGKVKIIISPKTLSQGIDIGAIGRIVHIGLPDSLREFYQREGRKGRREELKFSETIIVPSGQWDRTLLLRGIESLNDWLNLPIEKVIINNDNEYRILFESLIKYTSPSLRSKIKKEELEFLKKLGLVSGGELSIRGKEVMNKLNFYEFAPPYGINRILIDKDQKYYLEEISHCDLVEKFQIGCFDYSQEAVVTKHKLGGESGRVVMAVFEEKLNEANLYKNEAFAQVIEEYEETKIKWKENVSLLNDFIYGRLHSEVACVVFPPRKGFGTYLKLPNRVHWKLKSFKPRVKTVGERTIVYYDKKVFDIPSATYGKYSDYTYGAFYELDPKEDTSLIRIGLTYIMLILRMKMQIPFETIMYDVGKFGDKKFFGLHEPECAGLIKKLDWLKVRELVKNYKPKEIDEVLFEMLDEYSYGDFLKYDLDWNIAKKAAIRVLDYILLEEKILAKFKGMEISIPKPSYSLKLASLDLIDVPFNDDSSIGLFGFSIFDGESKFTKVMFIEDSRVENFEDSIKNLSKLVDEEFTILVYNLSSFNEVIKKYKIKSLGYIIQNLQVENKLIEVQKNIADSLNMNLTPLEELEKMLNVKREVNLLDLSMEINRSIQRIMQEKRSLWKNFTKFLSDKIAKYLEQNCETIYSLYLISKEIAKVEGSTDLLPS